MNNHASHPNIIKRLKRAEGHLKKVIQMIEDSSPCLDVSQQLHAVVNALKKSKEVYIQDHIQHCLTEEDLLDNKVAQKKIEEFKEITKYL